MREDTSDKQMELNSSLFRWVKYSVIIVHGGILGSRDGTVVEHLPPTQASHCQCSLGSIPGLGVVCGLSLFNVNSRPCSERFFSGYSGFPLSSKTNISKFQFDLENEATSLLVLDYYATLIKQRLFIYFFILVLHNNIQKLWQWIGIGPFLLYI